MARQKEQQHPFYKPLWRRVAIVAVIVFWLGFEIYQRATDCGSGLPEPCLPMRSTPSFSHGRRTCPRVTTCRSPDSVRGDQFER